MKSKSRTLEDILTTLAVLGGIGILIALLALSVTNDSEAMAYLNPRTAQAIALQHQADVNAELAKQMAEQNRLLREQIEKNSHARY